MKTRDIEVGMAVRVKRGYAVRPAIVTGIRAGVSASIGVHFTDLDGVDTASITNRQNLFGADVVPGAILPARNPEGTDHEG